MRCPGVPFAPHPVAERRADLREMALALPVVDESVFANILLASVGLLGPGERRPADDAVESLVDVTHQFAVRIEQRGTVLDKGYRGHDETASTVYISGQKRGIKTQRLKRSLKRRQAIEPVIGHLKAGGLLERNHLKGTQGDQLNVLLSCAGHNLRLILRRLRLFCLEKRTRILAWLRLLVPAARLSGAGTQLNRKLACLAPLPAPIMVT